MMPEFRPDHRRLAQCFFQVMDVPNNEQGEETSIPSPGKGCGGGGATAASSLCGLSIINIICRRDGRTVHKLLLVW